MMSYMSMIHCRLSWLRKPFEQLLRTRFILLLNYRRREYGRTDELKAANADEFTRRADA